MSITKSSAQLVQEATAQIDGGFTDWVKQGAPVETYEAHKARRHPKG